MLGDGDGAAASTGRPEIHQTLELETYLHSARRLRLYILNVFGLEEVPTTAVDFNLGRLSAKIIRDGQFFDQKSRKLPVSCHNCGHGTSVPMSYLHLFSIVS